MSYFHYRGDNFERPICNFSRSSRPCLVSTTPVEEYKDRHPPLSFVNVLTGSRPQSESKRDRIIKVTRKSID